jgi:aryl-alcohol dehydrogenase-like predicted oxidoreductase
VDEVRLGRSGLVVSRLALGTMTFGLRCDAGTARQIFDTAIEAGVTLIDTADVYPYAGDAGTVGVTEELLGSWLPAVRDEVLIATKVGGQTGPRAWDVGNSRKHVVAAVHACLRRLRTDYLDIVQLHGFDDGTPVAETVDALSALVRAGAIRYLGVSNFTAYQMGLFAGTAERTGGVPITVSQPRYSLLDRGIEREILGAAGELGIGVMVYNPLAGGMLTGRHRPGTPDADGRFGFGAAAGAYRRRYWTDAAFTAVDAIRDVADRAGVPLPTLAMAWVLANPAVDVAILGASDPAHVRSAVAALDVKLEAGTMAELDAITGDFRAADGVNAGLPRRR